MIYALSIDWLSLFCLNMSPEEYHPVTKPGLATFDYKHESFGTRCFSEFYRVRIANEDGGWDEFAEVQAKPYSSILPEYAIIVRFCNRTLYMPNFWELAEDFMQQNEFSCQGISRIDICADFNDFATLSPISLIEGFAAKRFRHIGRGVGALYFNHQVVHKQYGLHYTGLSFGTHSSDAHVYLYNKTFELDTQGDKPWIREIWRNAGLDIRNVWRLEVSIKSSGLKFKDKTSKQEIKVDMPMIYEQSALDKVYHTFVSKLFAFIRNRADITNVSREPRIVLFDSKPAYDRGAIRNLSPGDRMEKILIKHLYQFADRYRGLDIFKAQETSQHLANCLAYATDLHDWYEQKQKEWEKPIHK